MGVSPIVATLVTLQKRAVFYFHDYGRKSKATLYNVNPFLEVKPC